jgi:hypothetical protein
VTVMDIARKKRLRNQLQHGRARPRTSERRRGAHVPAVDGSVWQLARGQNSANIPVGQPGVAPSRVFLALSAASTSLSGTNAIVPHIRRRALAMHSWRATRLWQGRLLVGEDFFLHRLGRFWSSTSSSAGKKSLIEQLTLVRNFVTSPNLELVFGVAESE